MNKLPYYDVETVMAFSKEELSAFLQSEGKQIVELEDMLTTRIRQVADLEKDIKHYKERIRVLEEIKVEKRASVKVWRAITAAAIAVGALLGSIFGKRDD